MTIVDQLILGIVCLVHAMQDVLVWFASDESEGIDVVAGDVLEATDLVVDVFGQKLAA